QARSATAPRTRGSARASHGLGLRRAGQVRIGRPQRCSMAPPRIGRRGDLCGGAAIAAGGCLAWRAKTGKRKARARNLAASLSVRAVVPQDTQAPSQRRDAAATTWHGLFAVLFTYNRKDLAAQCLASVLEQDLAPERIVLVDNGCTDGTREALAARGLLADPRIDYLRLERNLGASGGLR